MAGSDAVGVERVFESGVKEIVGVCSWATVEERVGLGHEDADMWSDVDAVDDKFFTDKRIEEGEIEFRGFDDVVDVEGVGFAGFGSADVGQHAVAGIKHCVVLSDDVLFGEGETGIGEGDGAVLGGDAEGNAAVVVE